ncbi:opsin-5-like [Biomphalaria glabrata]|uniref:Opsin-5-like n=1 Tax=Biomphalaria glabrata TaxID=6526 RepID=A0A9W3AR53_BIOGL|nr:opsin-5-like [Biomphalaria glabrata]KAI8742502.1 rhodopsin; G0-coupled-like [Biomphalaria glabrata]
MELSSVTLHSLYNWTTPNISSAEPSDKDGGFLFLAIAIYLTTIGIIAIFGNSLVLTVLLGDESLRRKPHNLLLISLAVCDLGVLLGGYPFTIISGYSQRWVFDDLTCKFAGFWTFFLSLTSMNTLVAVCVYRYIMICAPGKAFILTRSFTLYVIIGTWFYGFFWTALPLMGWGSYGLEPFLISCSLDWANDNFSNVTYMVATILFCYILHVVVMISCYRKISKTVRELAERDRERCRRIVSFEDMVHLSKVADDQQVTKMCFLVVLVFVGIWTPYALVCAVHIFYSLPLAATALPTMCAKLGCMINPMVYFLSNKGFRNKTLRMLRWRKRETADGSVVQRELLKKFDKITKDGIYLGTETIIMEKSETMF